MSGSQGLEIVVDELVLRGVRPENAHATGAALEDSLRALAEPLARSGASLPARDEPYRALPAVTVPAASPAALGASVAGAVWDGLSGRGRS
jgi:hypothetical protein